MNKIKTYDDIIKELKQSRFNKIYKFEEISADLGYNIIKSIDKLKISLAKIIYQESLEIEEIIYFKNKLDILEQIERN